MKKVGLITCYADNYGACLQAYALQQMIIEMEYKAEIIKYSPISSMKEHRGLIKLIVPILNILRSIKNRKSIDRYQGEMRKNFRKFKKECLTFGNIAYPTIESLYKSPPEYDAFVTGSDQLWNPIIHGMTNNRAHFLDFAPEGKKRIAYSPSIGVSKIPDSCKKEMKQLVEKMDVVSVREEDGKRIINEISEKNCRVVLDPTLLLDKDEWSKIIKNFNGKKPYIFCYLFSKQDYVGEFVEYVKMKTCYEIVVIPFTKREMERGYVVRNDAGPKEFLGLIKNASLVITDSFHATAFSINFNVPFYSLLRNSDTELNNMNSRIFNILEIFDLKNRLISSAKDYPDEINFDIDFKKVNKILDERREEDKKFLKTALSD